MIAYFDASAVVPLLIAELRDAMPPAAPKP
jgi:hypothetical protein